MQNTKSKIAIALLCVAIFVGIVALWNAPNSFWQEIRDSDYLPKQHYEDGQLIRTIRGQDFIVTGSGSHERLIPITPEDRQTTVVIVKTNYVRVEQ